MNPNPSRPPAARAAIGRRAAAADHGGAPRALRLALAALALATLAACGLFDPEDNGGTPPPPPPPTGTPAVTGSNPADGASNVYLDATVTTTLHLPNGGVDAGTLSQSTVQLARTSDGATIPGSVATSGGRDAISYQPFEDLAPETSYTFRVTSSVRDEAGVPFEPYTAVFTTGTQREAVQEPNVSFTRSSVYEGRPITSLAFGPDGRLYATTLNDGRMLRWDVAGDGTLSNEQQYLGFQGRVLVGMAFDPQQPDVLWVSHNAPLWGHGDPDFAPDFTGAIARVTVHPDAFASSTRQDYVVGLPRSVYDHLTNELSFGPDGMLYVTQGSNTAAGGADSTWGMRPERLLSAAMLRIDPRRTTGLPINVQTESYGGTSGSYNPRAANAPVQIYATGLRNAFDFVWHSNGNLYVPTNGTNAGGRAPGGGGAPELSPVWVQPDFVYRVEQGGYYGHPNPLRGEYILNGGNPTGTLARGDEVLPHSAGGVDYVGYPVGTQPDPNYRGFEWRFCCNDSINGIIEYRSDTFGGALQGKLLLVRFAKGYDIVVLTVAPNGAISTRTQLADGFERPLNLVEDPSTGNIYVSELVHQGGDGGRLQLLRVDE